MQTRLSSRHLFFDSLESFVTPLPYIPYMSTKRRKRSIRLLVCPSCQQMGVLRKIVYGMPDLESFDFEKFAVGGCCVEGDGTDPDVQCRECEWEGLREMLEKMSEV
jgi:hypothetical protein